jgi:hypothetical protein
MQKTLDVWLQQQPRRCNICGCHVATQGHSRRIHYAVDELCELCHQHLARPVDTCPTGLHA